MSKKSQSSLEFLIIFGVGFFMIIVLSGVFLSYSTGAKSSLDKSQIENIGNGIMENVEKIYFMGDGNRVTYNVNFPEGIKNMSIYHMNLSNSTDDIYFDYLNISYYYEGSGEISNIFTTNENYIRFNCSRCYHGPIINGSGVSYFNYTSDFAGGPKKIRIYSMGDYVNIEFIRD